MTIILFSIIGIIVDSVQLVVDIIKLIFDLKIIEPLNLHNIFHKNKSKNLQKKSQGNQKKRLNSKQVRLIKRRLRAMIFTSRKDKYGFKIVSGSKLMIALKPYVSYNNCVKLIKYWKDCNYLSYEETTLESQSVIRILREDNLIESVNSCKS